MCKSGTAGGGLQEGGGFPIYFYIFERGWLKQNSVKVHVYGVGLQEGGGLQEQIQYVDCTVAEALNILRLFDVSDRNSDWSLHSQLERATVYTREPATACTTLELPLHTHHFLNNNKQ